jgi:hypothetical protein
MVAEQATTVRKEWSSVCDSVVREKPRFIKRTHDEMVLSSYQTMLALLKDYHFSADRCDEEDGSVSLALKEIDLVVNAASVDKAKREMGAAILEYAEEYYEYYPSYSVAPNRKDHLPYVMKALLINNADTIGEGVICA